MYIAPDVGPSDLAFGIYKLQTTKYELFTLNIDIGVCLFVPQVSESLLNFRNYPKRIYVYLISGLSVVASALSTKRAAVCELAEPRRPPNLGKWRVPQPRMPNIRLLSLG
jgi:hypothetical protein